MNHQNGANIRPDLPGWFSCLSPNSSRLYSSSNLHNRSSQAVFRPPFRQRVVQCCQIPPSLHGRFCQKPRPVWTLSLPAKSFFTAGFTAGFMATLRLHFYLFHEKNHISNPLTHTHMHQYNKPHSRDMFQTSLLYSEQCQRVIKYITTQ